MDDDVKTLLAILALVYGSSNGIGLLKDYHNPVKENTKILKTLKADPRADVSTIRAQAKDLLFSLFKPLVILYGIIVLIVPVFLFFVARYGPFTTLAWIGLAGNATPTPSPKPLTFYRILFGLSLIATIHYLSDYLKGWWALYRYIRPK